MEYVLTQLGIAVFAISGVLSATHQRLDILSIVLVGLLTALGGGTVRDMILDLPVFWVEDLVYFWVAVGASFLTFVGHHFHPAICHHSLEHLYALTLDIGSQTEALIASGL